MPPTSLSLIPLSSVQGRLSSNQNLIHPNGTGPHVYFLFINISFLIFLLYQLSFLYRCHGDGPWWYLLVWIK